MVFGGWAALFSRLSVPPSKDLFATPQIFD
jgi:hypothetical protein